MAKIPKCQMDSSMQVKKIQAEVSVVPTAVLNCSSEPGSSHVHNETASPVLEVLYIFTETAKSPEIH